MAYQSPRCGGPVRRGSSTAAVAGGAVGAMLHAAFGSFQCKDCGPIPKSEFPPGSPRPTLATRLAGWTHLTALQAMSRASKNPLVHFLPVRGATHFSTLAPTTRLIAGKILRDTGPACNITFTEGEVNQAFAR